MTSKAHLFPQAIPTQYPIYTHKIMDEFKAGLGEAHSL